MRARARTGLSRSVEATNLVKNMMTACQQRGERKEEGEGRRSEYLEEGKVKDGDDEEGRRKKGRIDGKRRIYKEKRGK